MDDKRFRFFFERQPFQNGFSVYMGVKENGKVSEAEPLTFRDVNPGKSAYPCMFLSQDDCQGLIDELWQAGLRPSEGSGSAGSLKATQYHLEDMRKIAFKLLKL